MKLESRYSIGEVVDVLACGEQMNAQCSQRVYGGSFHGHPCSRTAKFEHEGESYCGVHYPPNVKARRAKRDAEFTEEMRRKAERRKEQDTHHVERQRKADCFDSLLSALKEALAWIPGNGCTAEEAGAKCDTLTGARAQIEKAIRKAEQK